MAKKTFFRKYGYIKEVPYSPTGRITIFNDNDAGDNLNWGGEKGYKHTWIRQFQNNRY